jgi:FixJ family two-component response regulator
MCELVCTLFRIEGFEVAFTTNAAEFYEIAEKHPPDIVVVGDEIGPVDGVNFITALKSRLRGVPAILLLEKIEIERTVVAVKHGAWDVFAKPIDGERLIHTVKQAIDTHSGLVTSGGRPRPASHSRLSPREQQVLECVLDGATNKEAARELNISPRTVEVHRHRIMEKMGARNTADLVRIALG